MFFLYNLSTFHSHTHLYFLPTQFFYIIQVHSTNTHTWISFIYLVFSVPQVVTKFIKKNKVYRDSWVDDLLLGRRVPLEVSLLMSLDHPNIVSIRLSYLILSYLLMFWFMGYFSFPQ